MRRLPTILGRRTAVWLAAVATMATTVLAVATPARAANINVTVLSCTGGVVILDKNDVVAVPGDTITVVNPTASGLTVNVVGGTGVNPTTAGPLTNAQQALTVTAATGGFDVSSGTCTSAGHVDFGPGGGSSAPQPQTFTLSLTPSAGTTCTQASASGLNTAWVALPAASDCKPPANKPNAKLLGWATSQTFPVTIAQRQVTNGWGAYETFGSNGQLTGVFIPAGKSANLSANTVLYAIWSE